MKKEDWFESWFNSPYYHILYKHRDDNEAQFFIDNLVSFLKIPSNSRVLDLACGRGRHAKYLYSKGLTVTGIDLSEQSIAFANQFKSENLTFLRGDMRNDLEVKNFEYIFNLFTSFGYFDSLEEHLKAIKGIAKALNPNGYFIIDFMNTAKVAKGLVEDEIKKVDGLTFSIKRTIENEKIIKTISFQDNNHDYSFQEKVAALSFSNFESFFAQSGLKIKHKFGDFNLSPFDIDNSDRLILIAQKQ